MRILGIDPGVNGALAVLNAPVMEVCCVHDIPTATIATSAKRRRNVIEEHNLAQLIIKQLPIDHAIIERVAAMPKQGVSSTFRFGFAAGIIRGIVAGLQIPFDEVRPQDWKRHCKLGRDKDQARLEATRRWPEWGDQFRRKKDADRAEAVLIAAYGADILLNGGTYI